MNQIQILKKQADCGKPFIKLNLLSLAEDSDVYGIYHNYESDASGAFDVNASWKKGDDLLTVINKATASDVQSVIIAAGKYLVFSEKGAMPNAVISAWQNIWAYFNDEGCEHTRLYHIDFEYYVNDSQVDVYIGIE